MPAQGPTPGEISPLQLASASTVVRFARGDVGSARLPAPLQARSGEGKRMPTHVSLGGVRRPPRMCVYMQMNCCKRVRCNYFIFLPTLNC